MANKSPLPAILPWSIAPPYNRDGQLANAKIFYVSNLSMIFAFSAIQWFLLLPKSFIANKIGRSNAVWMCMHVGKGWAVSSHLYNCQLIASLSVLCLFTCHLSVTNYWHQHLTLLMDLESDFVSPGSFGKYILFYLRLLITKTSSYTSPVFTTSLMTSSTWFTPQKRQQ